MSANNSLRGITAHRIAEQIGHADADRATQCHERVGEHLVPTQRPSPSVPSG
jgi:hypothetical protein